MPELTTPRTICVLGFHRSGTSLTARALNLLGVDLGAEAELLPPSETDNARGYWEPRWMNDLNDELLAALGVHWWDAFPAGPGWEQAPQLDALRERAAALLEQQLGGRPLRGWKDPRMSLTLPFWRPLLEQPRYVVCVRNPVDAVASLQRRPALTLPVRQWGELWLEYTARALRETDGSPRLVVFYEDFFHDGARQVARLAAFAGIDLEAGDARAQAAVAEIAQDLRHHTTSPFELAASPGIPASARMLYLALLAAHRPGGEEPADAAAEALERLAPELWWEWREAAQRGAELERLAPELERTAAELASVREALAGRDEKLAAMEGSLSWRVTAPLRAARARRRGS